MDATELLRDVDLILDEVIAGTVTARDVEDLKARVAEFLDDADAYEGVDAEPYALEETLEGEEDEEAGS